MSVDLFASKPQSIDGTVTLINWATFNKLATFGCVLAFSCSNINIT